MAHACTAAKLVTKKSTNRDVYRLTSDPYLMKTKRFINARRDPP
jgi:hypothetical protein